MNRRLIHYSDKWLKRVRSMAHDAIGAGFIKTPGLWVSVEGDDDWINWCKSERPGWLQRYTCAHEVILNDKHKVLTLSGAKQLDAFTKQYGMHPPYRSALGPLDDNGVNYRHCWIDWPKVREKHQGLIIAPYCWSRRLELMWYYGWDCASGVIWDAGAIKELRPMIPAEPERKIEVEAD